ncbi:MAG: DinB family protein [Acidimicrobiales bacterium]
MEFPEPTHPYADRREVLLEYLDFYRGVLRAKVIGLDDDALRTSRLPSGWAPIELIKHLVHVERRWLVWGFEGEDVGDPWADERDDRWFVAAHEQLEDLLDELDAGGRRTREIVHSHELSDIGAPGDRWRGEPPASLERVLLHLMQEYARHAGQLDVVRELIDETTGE